MIHPLGLLGLALVLLIVWEGFETIILPRSVMRRLRLTRLFYRTTWSLWTARARRMPPDTGRELYLSYYGPVSLPCLVSLWAILLITGFGLLQWSVGMAPLGTCLYFSGVTFFTLGYGDIVPHTGLARLLAVTEAGVGFGFLAIVIGYLPVLYQAFSRREANISLLDARGGSPATAGELLRRHGNGGRFEDLPDFLASWEQWCSELLESHLSYAVLSYYRSQHEHQSWLAAMTTVMDLCALGIVGVEGASPWFPRFQWQAQLTFAMARHALVDLAYIFATPPVFDAPDRLPPERLVRLRETLAAAGFPLRSGPDADAKLAEVRRLYEPYIHALGRFFFFDLPPWLPDTPGPDNWQTSAWEHDGAHF